MTYWGMLKRAWADDFLRLNIKAFPVIFTAMGIFGYIYSATTGDWGCFRGVLYVFGAWTAILAMFSFLLWVTIFRTWPKEYR